MSNNLRDKYKVTNKALNKLFQQNKIKYQRFLGQPIINRLNNQAD